MGKEHRRKSTRLRNYDYRSTGWYFVTLLCQSRISFFGEILDGAMKLNTAGQMVSDTWCDLEARFSYLRLGPFVVMPDHFHGLIGIRRQEADLGGDTPGRRGGREGGVGDHDGGMGDHDGGVGDHDGGMGDHDGGMGDPCDRPYSGRSSDQIATAAAPQTSKGEPRVRPEDRMDSQKDREAGMGDHKDRPYSRRSSDQIATAAAPQTSKGEPRVRPSGTESDSLGRIIQAFKSITTVEYIRGVERSGWPPFPGRLWHRNYHDRIIRSMPQLWRVAQYIADNPARWTNSMFDHDRHT